MNSNPRIEQKPPEEHSPEHIFREYNLGGQFITKPFHSFRRLVAKGGEGGVGGWVGGKGLRRGKGGEGLT